MASIFRPKSAVNYLYSLWSDHFCNLQKPTIWQSDLLPTVIDKACGDEKVNWILTSLSRSLYLFVMQLFRHFLIWTACGTQQEIVGVRNILNYCKYSRDGALVRHAAGGGLIHHDECFCIDIITTCIWTYPQYLWEWKSNIKASLKEWSSYTPCSIISTACPVAWREFSDNDLL